MYTEEYPESDWNFFVKDCPELILYGKVNQVIKDLEKLSLGMTNPVIDIDSGYENISVVIEGYIPKTAQEKKDYLDKVKKQENLANIAKEEMKRKELKLLAKLQKKYGVPI